MHRAENWRKTYTDEDMQFIRENYKELTDPEMGVALGRTASSIKTQRQKMDLWKFKHEEVDWSAAEIEIFKEHYPTTPNEEMLELLPGRTIQSLYKKTQDLGVKKTDAFMKKQNRKLGLKLGEIGKGHRFKKGHVPMNKGMKQEDFMSAETIEKTKATRFKKGNKPHNTMFDGAITIRKDSNGGQYMYIRISKDNWELYHQVVYRKEFGAIPKGHLLRFKDGNSLNVTIENLECITKAEHARRNRDPEKALNALREYQKKFGTPSQNLNDKMVAFWLSGNDNDLKEYILEHRPDLIKVARANYKLKRAIRNGQNDN